MDRRFGKLEARMERRFNQQTWSLAGVMIALVGALAALGCFTWSRPSAGPIPVGSAPPVPTVTMLPGMIAAARRIRDAPHPLAGPQGQRNGSPAD